MSSSSDQDDHVALTVSKHIKQLTNKRSKQSIQRTGPLRSSQARSSTAAGQTAAITDKQWLQQCKELYKGLPKNSKWAKHKLKVVSKAISILEKAEASRTAAEAAELQKLLGTLKIGQPRAAAAAAAAVGPSAAVGPPAAPAIAAAAAAAADEDDMLD